MEATKKPRKGIFYWIFVIVAAAVFGWMFVRAIIEAIKQAKPL
jgi:hypothetical protein